MPEVVYVKQRQGCLTQFVLLLIAIVLIVPAALIVGPCCLSTIGLGILGAGIASSQPAAPPTVATAPASVVRRPATRRATTSVPTTTQGLPRVMLPQATLDEFREWLQTLEIDPAKYWSTYFKTRNFRSGDAMWEWVMKTYASHCQRSGITPIPAEKQEGLFSTLTDWSLTYEPH